ncbi:hypothetical protein, partial [Klebsiella pneumoniae]|uniref:hypothetical protein n=1 Tax=Klebsiella pneumoniae TaxID=573 RepID=UPI003D043F3E
TSAAAFISGTVINDGTMSGSVGIDAAAAVVTNRGGIIGSGVGITTSGGSLSLDNAGTVTGFFGVFADVAAISNAGSISGTGATGIDAAVRLS